jgi:hypothetical protein
MMLHHHHSQLSKLLCIVLAIAFLTQPIGLQSSAHQQSTASCGTWALKPMTGDKDERMKTEIITSGSGEDCHGEVAFGNATDFHGFGGYTFELKMLRDNSTVIWSPPEDTNGFIYLTPLLDLDLHAFPINSFSQGTITIRGNMTTKSFSVDLAIFALRSALALIPGGSCVVPKEQLATVAIREASLLGSAAGLSLKGDFLGARNELSRVLPEFYKQAGAALKDIGIDCAVDGLQVLAKKPLAIVKIAIAYLSWIPVFYFDYFKYGVKPVMATIDYTPAPTPTPTPVTIASMAGIWEGLISGGGDNLDISQQVKYEIRTSCGGGKPCVTFLTDPNLTEVPFWEPDSRGNTFCFSDTFNLYCFTLQSDGTVAFEGNGPMWSATGILTKRDTTAAGATPSPHSGTISSIEYVGKIDTEASKIDFVDNLAFVGSFGRRLALYDVSNPASPVGFQLQHSQWSNDFAVAGKYVYVVDYSPQNGVTLLALDTSNLQGSWKYVPLSYGIQGWQLRAAGDKIYFLDTTNKVHILDLPKTGFRKLGTFTIPLDANKGINDFAVTGDFAYILVSEDGLHIVDISDPKSAHEVGFLALPGTTTRLAVSDQFAYIAALDDGLHIIDVANPKGPVEISPYGTKTKYIETVNVVGKYAYLYVDTDHIEVIDISNPLAPTLVASTDFHNVSNINVKDNYMYVAAGNDGVHIYRLKK